MKLTAVIFVATFLALAAISRPADAAETVMIDLTKPEQVRAWQATHDVAPLRASAEGMVISITGDDPFISSPPIDLPAKPMWLTLRMKSSSDGPVEVFYYQDAPHPSQSASVMLKKGEFNDVRLPLPAMGAGWHIRIDPPGTSGEATIASAQFEPRDPFVIPEWPKPTITSVDDVKQAAGVVVSGPLELRHSGAMFGGIELRVDGEKMAVGLGPAMIGYLADGYLKWMQGSVRPRVEPLAGGFVETIALTDTQNVAWTLQRTYAAGKLPGTIDVTTNVQVARDRPVVFLPLLMLSAGAGSFGEHKSQGLFPGLEYLDDEPSSSQKDIVGPQSNRLVPDPLKVTFPLMAIGANDRFLGVMWEMQPSVAPLFDSPDRHFGSGGHAMGLIFPGSSGNDRVESSLLPEHATTILADKPISLHATIIGARGTSLAGAVEKYVALRGLPPIPDIGMTLKNYVAFAAGGWMDSKIRDGNLYRHALGGASFNPHPSADAAVWMRWLGANTDDPELRQRLNDTASAALTPVANADLNFSGVSHIRYPVAALLTGEPAVVEQNAAVAERTARTEVERFEADGSLRYRRDPNRPDYGKTHNAPDANGLTAGVVASILQNASISDDPKLIADAIRLLRAMDKFDNGVPRGAQTWEVPLHTPDVLASANLVKAYVLGFELTGDDAFRSRAQYWAWTGVPFVYLRNPTDRPIGPYATIAVYGATNWEAPIWMGKPVQWCGLVYADAIGRLAPLDPAGPWLQLAKGIAASGIQQSWPASASATQQGLLPDSFELRSQRRDGPDINPGTVQAVALRLFDQPPVYDFHHFAKFGAIVHAPGKITVEQDEADVMRFTVEPWMPSPVCILVAGLQRTVLVDNSTVPAPSSSGRIVLPSKGKTQIVIRTRSAS